MKNEKLRKARKERRLTQKVLAEKVGVETVTVRKWEDGTRNPSPECRSLLCQILEKTEEELGLGNSATQEESPVQSPPERPVQADQNRLSMMKRVDTYWISGVLARSLREGKLIPLHLRERPDAVINPWAETVQQTNLPPRTLPEKTRIRDVYQEADGSLLLLGEPGAGKTTSLLALARDLIEEASVDEKRPMPVIFNLASWAQKRSEFQTWLVDELQIKYQVPQELAASWVAENQIAPLLDGLDEVAEGYRAQCLQAINKYRREHGFVPMIVCCRTPEYLALSDRLALGKAIVIEPLSWEEIKSYISKAGKSLEGVKIALQSDQGLREMVSTPLMLTVLSLAFQNTSLDTLLSVDDPIQRRTLLFKKYVEVVLQRRGTQTRYSLEQTQHWLAWLAVHLKQQNQTEFYLERMQPNWLPNDHTRGRYRNMVIRLIFGLNSVALCALFALFRGDSVPTKPGLFSWLGATAKGSELLEWMRPGLGGGLAGASSLDLLMVVISTLIVLIVNMRIIPTLSWKTARIGLLRGLRNGLLVGGPVTIFSGLILGPLRGVETGLYAALILWLLTGLNAMLRYGSEQHGQTRLSVMDRLTSGVILAVCGMLSFALTYWIQAGETDLSIKYGAIVGISSAIYSLTGTMDLIRGLGMHIEPAEIVAWSWHKVTSNLAAHVYKAALLTLFVQMATIIVFGCISSLFYGLAYGVRYGLVYGLITGLILGITAIVTQTLTSGWSSSILPKHQQIRPNKGITLSARNSLLAAIVSGPVAGMISGIAIAFAFKIVAALAGWQILGVGFGLILGIEFTIQVSLAYGGIAVIEHYVLRWYLWREGQMPLGYVSFLDHAAERILLRKIGGGYMFSHPLLLDYFASLKHEPQKEEK